METKVLYMMLSCLFIVAYGYKKQEYDKCYSSGTPLDKIMLSHPDAD